MDSEINILFDSAVGNSGLPCSSRHVSFDSRLDDPCDTVCNLEDGCSNWHPNVDHDEGEQEIDRDRMRRWILQI